MKTNGLIKITFIDAMDITELTGLERIKAKAI